MPVTMDGGTAGWRRLLRPRRLPSDDDVFEVAPPPVEAGAVWHLPSSAGGALPDTGEFAFATSGHTARPRRWLRSADQLRQEVRLLDTVADLGACDGIVCFAPLEHIYGFVAGLCTATELRLPLWVTSPPAARAALPALGVRRPVLVTLPSTLAALQRQPRWLATFEGLTVLHSTGRLPETGRRLPVPAGALSLVELFGATETGLVAHRRSAGANGLWTLADDVEPVPPAGKAGQAAGALSVRSPRLARRPGRSRPPVVTLGDEVRYAAGGRHFRFLGRASHLLRVDGRRVDLDAVEARLRQALVCRDLACVLQRDDAGGESYDLVVVPRHDLPLTVTDVWLRARAVLGVQHAPRRVRLVDALPRSTTGKVRLGEVAS